MLKKKEKQFFWGKIKKEIRFKNFFERTKTYSNVSNACCRLAKFQAPLSRIKTSNRKQPFVGLKK